MHVDPAIEERRKREPEAVADVILTCATVTDALRAKLSEAGFEVTLGEQEALGIVCGRVRLADIEKLAALPELESISPDLEQHAF